MAGVAAKPVPLAFNWARVSCGGLNTIMSSEP